MPPRCIDDVLEHLRKTRRPAGAGVSTRDKEKKVLPEEATKLVNGIKGLVAKRDRMAASAGGEGADGKGKGGGGGGGAAEEDPDSLMQDEDDDFE